MANLKEVKYACHCADYAEYYTPCAHMLAVIKRENHDPENWMDEAYGTNTYRSTYDEPLCPLSIQSLAATPDVETPAV